MIIYVTFFTFLFFVALLAGNHALRTWNKGGMFVSFAILFVLCFIVGIISDVEHKKFLEFKNKTEILMRNAEKSLEKVNSWL